MLKVCRDRATNSDDSSEPVLKDRLHVHKSVGSLFASSVDLRTHFKQDSSQLSTKSTEFNNCIDEDSRSCIHTNTEPLRYHIETSLGGRPVVSDGCTRPTAEHHQQVSSSFDSNRDRPTLIPRQLSVASFADKLMDQTSSEVRPHNNTYHEHRLLDQITPTESSANTNQYELSSVSSTSARAESNQISSENNYHNSDSLTGLKNRQQHRRLQQQVHQQLQKIYGDRLQAIEQQQQQQQLSSAMHEVRPMIHNQAKTKQTDVSNAARARPFDPSFRHDPNCPRLNRERLQAAHNNALANGHKLPLIRPIEEECYHAKRRANDEPSFNEYNDCIVLDEDKCDEKDNGHDDDDDQHHDVRDANNNNMHGRSNMLNNNSVAGNRGPMEADRKRQLESLHYATATAAALLNATANAAAAFAANENKLYSGDASDPNNKTNLIRQNLVNPSANTYQDVAQLNDHLYKVNQANHQQQQSHIGRQVQQQHQQMNSLQQPQQRLYQSFPFEQSPQRKLSATGASNGIGSHRVNNHCAQEAQPIRLDYGPASQRAQQAVTISSGAHRQQPQMQRQQQQNVAYSFDKIPSRPMNQSQLPPSLPKPKMHTRGMYQLQQQQAQLARQQQQQHLQRRFMNQQILTEQPHAQVQQRFSIAPNSMPTLAILHHKGKGKSLKVDLIGRLPLTQVAAPIKTYPAAAVTSSSQMQCYSQNDQHSIYTADLSSILAGRLPSRHMTNRSMMNVAANMPALTYTIPPSQNKINAGTQPQSRTNVVAIQAGPIQSSDSIASGRSDMPLVLGKRLCKASIIERICRIDLTAFWWALLIVCMISICFAVTIFKQFH